MNILVNLLNFRPGRIGGTETYLRELAAHLPEAAGSDRVTLLASLDVAGEFAGLPLDVAVVPASTAQICALRLLDAATGYEPGIVLETIARFRPDVMLFPQQVMFPRRPPCPGVVVVHDLYHVVCPQHLTAAQRWYRRRCYPPAMQLADRLIAVSETTRRAVLRHTGRRQSEVTVVPHGVRRFDRGAILPDDQIGRPYVYYPAVTLPHKNHATLFRAMAALAARGEFPYQLVLTGEQTAHWSGLQRELRRLRIADRVTHLGYVPYSRVERLIRGADCLLFPSAFEGFGIPVLEAAAFGRKIITSRLDVFEEIGVPEACRIDFADPAALARALHDTAPAGLTRPPGTWADCAAATLDVLREAADERPVLRLNDRPARPQAASAGARRAA